MRAAESDVAKLSTCPSPPPPPSSAVEVKQSKMASAHTVSSTVRPSDRGHGRVTAVRRATRPNVHHTKFPPQAAKQTQTTPSTETACRFKRVQQTARAPDRSLDDRPVRPRTCARRNGVALGLAKLMKSRRCSKREFPGMRRIASGGRGGLPSLFRESSLRGYKPGPSHCGMNGNKRSRLHRRHSPSMRRGGPPLRFLVAE